MTRRPLILASAATAAMALALLPLAAAPGQDEAAGAGATKSPVHRTPADTGTPVAFIGVATSLATPSLREQLSLPPGVGLVVDSVDPDSPAEQAGIQPHDVLHKLDDQILVNVQQFAVLVRTCKPGERVALTVIRKGQPIRSEVTLAERMLLPIDESPQRVQPSTGATQPIPLPRPGTGRMSGVITHTDNDHIITITTHDDSTSVTVKDRTGKVICEGPLDTPEDRAKIPADLRAKIERIESTSRQLHDLHNAPRVPPSE